MSVDVPVLAFLSVVVAGVVDATCIEENTGLVVPKREGVRPNDTKVF